MDGSTPAFSPSRSMPVICPKPNCLEKSCSAFTPISGPSE
ncbi:Uncharacterised protein [Bordetella pertussis]|nr:Uncharacterised protein [Bordetella pertussis]